MDLPQQIALMREATKGKTGAERIHAHPANLLDPEVPFPTGFDVIWMSQFLDCFTEEQATVILRRAAASMNGYTSLYIMEPFWDRQRLRNRLLLPDHDQPVFHCHSQRQQQKSSIPKT